MNLSVAQPRGVSSPVNVYFDHRLLEKRPWSVSGREHLIGSELFPLVWHRALTAPP